MKSSLAVALLVAGSVGGETMCGQGVSGTTIANSNRNWENLCKTPANEGDECDYTCDAGYAKIGRHVCQNYDTQGSAVIYKNYFGGRCQRLCKDV